MIVYLLLLHFIADFVFQSNRIASTKSYNIKSVLTHILIYGMTLAAGLIFVTDHFIEFVIINTAGHFLTDYYSSKLTAYLWVKQDWHNFFVVIGADQFIHTFLIINTAFLL